MTNYQLPQISAERAVAALDAPIPPQICDLRKAAALGAQSIAGSTWLDPMTFDHARAAALPMGETLIFCVHGHEVSQFACALARIHGVQARYVVGGYEALVAAGARQVAL